MTQILSGKGSELLVRNLDGSYTFHGFHGTRRGISDSAETSHAGFHAGTEKAAKARLEHLAEDIEIGANHPATIGENPQIIPVDIILKKPYGLEQGGLTERELDLILEFPEKTEQLKKRGYDGIIYRNELEDPGSVSVVAFDSDAVKVRTRKEKYPTVYMTSGTNYPDVKPTPDSAEGKLIRMWVKKAYKQQLPPSARAIQ
jgi:hypothetical protein